MRLASLALLFWLACATVLAQAPQIGQPGRDAPWVPTPDRLMRRMLQLAETTKDDVVMDLGSGDGKIPIYAAKHYGVRAIGIELEANLIALSRKLAAAQGVAQRVTFVQQDLIDADLSRASVITIFISAGVMEKLKPRFLALRPGTRVISHRFNFGDWQPDEMVQVEERSAYLWVVPAKVAGEWTLRRGGEEVRLHIEQRYQMLTISGERGGKALQFAEARLRGTEIRFTSFERDGSTRHFEGRVDGARMMGAGWTASRQ